MVGAQPYLKSEPSLSTSVNWDVAANGMLYVSYDTNHNGKADFHTLHIVFRSFYSRATVLEIAKNFPGNLVFYVNHDVAGFFYIVDRNPLFYAIDVNEDGQWDLIYKDVSEDGVNGNEAFYDSPSGMFGPAIANF